MFIPIFFGHFVECYGEIGCFSDLHLFSGISLNYFFLLSGVGLYTAYKSDECYRLGMYFEFAVQRIKKLYFVYIISLLLYVPLIKSVKLAAYYVINFFISATLLQGLFPSTYVSHGINGAAWFLSSLFIAYTLAPWMISLVKHCKNVIAYIIGLWIIVALGGYISPAFDGMKICMFGRLLPIDIGSTAFLNVPKVMLGMCLKRVYDDLCCHVHLSPPPCTSFALPRISTVTLFVYWFLRTSISTFTEWVCFLDIFLCSVFVFGMFYEDNVLHKILCNRTVLWTAKYIGHVYLLHYPMLYLIREYVVTGNLIVNSMSAMEVLVLNVVCTAVLAWCCIKCESVWHRSDH